MSETEVWNLRIAEMKVFVTHPGQGKNWVFVRLTDHDGLHGWGEAYTQSGREAAVCSILETLRQYVEGGPGQSIRHFVMGMRIDVGSQRSSLELNSAVSAVEQAMWDITGKRAGMPVYRLLGGPGRPRVRVYASGWAERDVAGKPQEVAELAVQQVEAGYTALKFDPFRYPRRPYIDKHEKANAEATVRAVREAIGPDIDMLVEFHRRLSLADALDMMKRLEEYDPYWYEEPVPAHLLDSLRQCQAATSVPIVSGETLYGLTEFMPFFAERTVTIVNPDVCNTGGILEMTAIATAADAVQVKIAPHNFNSTLVGTMSSLHVAATVPNLSIMEYFTAWRAAGERLSPNPPVPIGGFLELPTDPGLGIELDVDALEAHPPATPRKRAAATPLDEAAGI